MSSIASSKSEFTFSERLPVEVRELIAYNTPMEKIGQLKNKELWQNCCDIRYQKFKEMPLRTIFRTAIDRIDQAHPNWGKGKKVAYCLKSANLALQDALYFLNDQHLRSFGITRQDSVQKLSYKERMLLGLLISMRRDGSLVNFFERFAEDIPAMQTFKDEIRNIYYSRKGGQQIRQWMHDNRALLIQGESIQFDEERPICPIIPGEISIIFKRFSEDFKQILISMICENRQKEPFERLLQEHSQSIVNRAPLLALLFGLSCEYDQFDLIEKCIKHPFFSTAIQTPLLPLEENGGGEILHRWEGTQRDWLQFLVQNIAENGCRSLKILLRLPEASRLSAPNVLNACLLSNHAQSLRIFSQSDLATHLTSNRILNKLLGGFTPITSEKLSALKQFPQLKGISADWFEPHIDQLLSNFCRLENYRENFKISLQMLMNAFPELAELLERKIAMDPSIDEEPMSIIKDLVKSHKIASQQPALSEEEKKE